MTLHTLQDCHGAFIEVSLQEPPLTIEEIFDFMDGFANDRRLPEALFGGAQAWYKPYPSHFPAIYPRPKVIDKAFRAGWIPFLVDQVVRRNIHLKQAIRLSRDAAGYNEHFGELPKKQFTKYLCQLIQKRTDELAQMNIT